MKLTWFGGCTFRIYLGGKIFAVTDGAGTTNVDAGELAAGVDASIVLPATGLPEFVPDLLRPRRMIDQPEGEGPGLFAFQHGVALIDPAEPPLFLSDRRHVEWDRTVDAGIVVLVGADATANAIRLFDAARPKLLALAVDEIGDDELAAIAAHAGQTAVQVLEPGLALEA